MAWVSTGVAVVGLATSAIGASANARAAGKSMKAQAAVDQASRVADAKGMIAQTRSQNTKVEELSRVEDIMKMQGKADTMMRKESYNETQAMALVMGAASGRVMGQGSLGAIYDKSNEDYMWDQMWAANNETISMAALEQDKLNVYGAGNTSLLLGVEGMNVSRMSSQAGLGNQSAAAQQAFNNTIMSAGQSAINNYGSNLLTKGKTLLDKARTT